MECAVCKADNPDGNLFCGKCGAAFGPAIQAVNREVERILQEKFKDRRLVEYEVSDNLIKRFEGIFKASAWVFGSALSVLTLALVIVGSLGFKTYTEATTTIRSAAAAAVTEVNGTARNAVEGITNSSQQAERVIDSFAKSPGLRKNVEVIEAQLKVADARVSAVLKVAEEDQKKLTDLDAFRRAHPDTKLSELNPSVFLPSSSPLLAIPSTGRYFTFGSQGQEVSTIQTRLKERGCYDGVITGVYDGPTDIAVTAYKNARGGVLFPALTSPTINSAGLISNITGVDSALFAELDSATVIARCPKR
jgi:hypothetical protein